MEIQKQRAAVAAERERWKQDNPEEACSPKGLPSQEIPGLRQRLDPATGTWSWLLSTEDMYAANLGEHYVWALKGDQCTGPFKQSLATVINFWLEMKKRFKSLPPRDRWYRLRIGIAKNKSAQNFPVKVKVVDSAHRSTSSLETKLLGTADEKTVGHRVRPIRCKPSNDATDPGILNAYGCAMEFTLGDHAHNSVYTESEKKSYDMANRTPPTVRNYFHEEVIVCDVDLRVLADDVEVELDVEIHHLSAYSPYCDIELTHFVLEEYCGKPAHPDECMEGGVRDIDERSENLPDARYLLYAAVKEFVEEDERDIASIKTVITNANGGVVNPFFALHYLSDCFDHGNVDGAKTLLSDLEPLLDVLLQKDNQIISCQALDLILSRKWKSSDALLRNGRLELLRVFFKLLKESIVIPVVLEIIARRGIVREWKRNEICEISVHVPAIVDLYQSHGMLEDANEVKALLLALKEGDLRGNESIRERSLTNLVWAAMEPFTFEDYVTEDGRFMSNHIGSVRDAVTRRYSLAELIDEDPSFGCFVILLLHCHVIGGWWREESAYKKTFGKMGNWDFLTHALIIVTAALILFVQFTIPVILVAQVVASSPDSGSLIWLCPHASTGEEFEEGFLWYKFAALTLCGMYFARLYMILLRKFSPPEMASSVKMEVHKQYLQSRIGIWGILDDCMDILYECFVYVVNVHLLLSAPTVLDMVLNSLALEFIAQIDDQYKAEYVKVYRTKSLQYVHFAGLMNEPTLSCCVPTSESRDRVFKFCGFATLLYILFVMGWTAFYCEVLEKVEI